MRLHPAPVAPAPTAWYTAPPVAPGPPRHPTDGPKLLIELKKQDPSGSPDNPAAGNRRIGLGIGIGGGTGFLLGAATTAWSGQTRWLGVGLVFGAATGLVLGVAAAARLRQRKGSR